MLKIVQSAVENARSSLTKYRYFQLKRMVSLFCVMWMPVYVLTRLFNIFYPYLSTLMLWISFFMGLRVFMKKMSLHS